MMAGRKRAILQYQTKTDAADAFGQLQLTWSVVSTHRAEVRSPRGNEATVALQVKAFVSLIIETRFPGFAFAVDGRLVDVTDPNVTSAIYNIVSSNDPDGRRRRLVTMATEVASDVSTNSSNL